MTTINHILQRAVHQLMKRGDGKWYDHQETVDMPDGSRWLVEFSMIHRGED